MSSEDRDPMFEGWDQLDWRARRERRFQRWLSAPGVEFQSETARQDYGERVQLLIDALMLKKPARVPVTALCGFFIGKHSGLTKKEFMHDYERAAGGLGRPGAGVRAAGTEPRGLARPRLGG
jgi:hypothetical protein